MKPTLMRNLAFLVLVALARWTIAAPFEIKIHDELIAPYMQTVYEIESHLYQASSSQGLKSNVFQTRFEYAHGVTKTSEWSGNVFISEYSGNSYFNGGKLAHMYIPQHDEAGWFHYGVKNEINVMRPVLEASQIFYELTPIIALRMANWRLTLNPSVDYYFNGGKQLVLVPAARLAYGLTRETSIGMEYYSEMGPLRHLVPSSHRPDIAYVVLDTKHRGSTFHFGLGKGVNPVSDNWVIKFIGSFEFK